MRAWLSYLPGWALMVVLSLIAMGISKLVVIGGKEPVEASALVVIFGILLRNTWGLPQVCVPGVKAAEKLLVLGIVLLGFGLNYNQVLNQSGSLLTIILVTMGVGFLSIYVLSLLARLSEKLGILLAVGTCICGGTAVALVAPLIKAKEEETSYAVAVIALWGVAAILLYPLVAQQLGVSDRDFGVFAGTAIHSTPQVVGAGIVYSEESGKIATAVKLVRNCFMAPLALLIALWFTSRQTQADAGPRVNFLKAFPWFLFAYFLTSWIGTQWREAQPTTAKEWIDRFELAGKFLIILGMAGVGLNTDLSSLRRVGMKPFLIGLLGALIVAATSIGLIWKLHE
jgi:uncharacterized integral membrane protein (TIGR00698 family)